MTAPEIGREALRWLRYAREDLDLAAAVARDDEEREPRHACFLAQQAAEKALKAALVLDQVEVPYIHDLSELRELIPPGWPLSAGPGELERLTEWASEARYPGDWPEPTHEDADHAHAAALAVYQSIAGEFARRGVISD